MAVVRDTRWPVYSATLAIAAIGWAVLTSMAGSVAAISGADALGPGAALLAPLYDLFADRLGNTQLASLLATLCGPAVPGELTITFAATAFAMWILMSVAMMLPSAAPMLKTYADIAHVARERGETTVPLWVLTAGYLVCWLVFAALATLAHLALIESGHMLAGNGLVQGWLAGGILLTAGLYQFSPLKDACLEKCRNPFNTLFARWSQHSGEVFRLGIGQGLFCVGCCWALMLTMLVVGVMNLVWMVFFTLFAVLEKTGSGHSTSRISGFILALWGSALIAFDLL